ncbi:MAG TPA: DUF1501 domain-containing protein [Bryobacteraceae bacterium]|jgi:uncharacterized protein (DUF1501 family)|nr:DUF1501 domain-containing protein [Bryobacteraceae bacterium]
MLIRSRRDFLKTTLKSVTALGAASAFGGMRAFAAGSNYQALVCIFLTGGNDGHNTVIPMATAQQNYSLYATNRGPLALSQGSLLPIAAGNDTYGLHPSLVEIQSLYNAKKAAILANVGMLVAPTNRTSYLAANGGASVPAALFSHSDQASQWQTSVPNGLGATGWGGRLADTMQGANSGAQFPPVTSIQGCGLFCTGNNTLPATVPPTGPVQLNAAVTDSNVQTAVNALLTFSNGVQLVQAANTIVTRGANYANTLASQINSVTINTVFPANNPLAAQLLMVAKLIGLRNTLGMTRQIFFCNLDGFDTHGSQLETQVTLLQQLSQGVSAFYSATQELAVDSQVTTFTASEFGRTLSPNGNDGSDHAWGNHHFIVGTGVNGGAMYGQFPSLAFGSQNDTNTRGTLIPTTAVDQYGATLASWFGVPGSSLAAVFPNSVNFQASSLNVGFMGA